MRFVNSWGQNFLHKWEIPSLLSTVGSISKAETLLPSKAGKFLKNCPHNPPFQILTNICPTEVQCYSKPRTPQLSPTCRYWGIPTYKSSCQNCPFNFCPSKSINKILTFWTQYVFYLLAKNTKIILNSLHPLCLTSLCCNGWPTALLFLALMEQS